MEEEAAPDAQEHEEDAGQGSTSPSHESKDRTSFARRQSFYAAGSSGNLGMEERRRAQLQAQDEEFARRMGSDKSAKMFAELFEKLLVFVAKAQADMVELYCQASDRSIQDEVGLQKFIKVQGIENLLSAQSHAQENKLPESLTIPIERSIDCFKRRSIEFLDGVAGDSEHEMPAVMYISTWMALRDDEVAVSLIEVFSRVAMFNPPLAAELLEQGVLKTVHQLLAKLRAPELVQDILVLLFRLCDMPRSVILSHLLQNEKIFQTVVECMQFAPLNIRLQCAGLRLLSLWATLQTYDERADNVSLRGLLVRSGARLVYEKLVENLHRSGLSHYETWVQVAGRHVRSLPQPKKQKSDSKEGEE